MLPLGTEEGNANLCIVIAEVSSVIAGVANVQRCRESVVQAV